MSKIKFGLFCYNTENIGDEVQSLAAKRFLPQVDYYFDRDDIDATSIKKGEKVKLIMNGWFTHKPENWPPKNSAIEPLLVAMHVEQSALEGRVADTFISERSKEFLKKFGPVGARNYPTLDLFKKNNIDAYFSGCVTLTLNPDKAIKRGDFVLAVDVSDAVYHAMQKRTKRRIIRLDTYRSPDMTYEEKFTLAKFWLFLYQSAHSVVTPRLHTMLPCLAFKTPVFAITGRDPQRYAGLVDLVRHSTEKEFLDNPKVFNLDKPGENPSSYLVLRKDLEERCTNFTGYDSKKSFLGEEKITDLLENPDFLQLICGMVDATLKRDLLAGDVVYLRKLNSAHEKRINDLLLENTSLRERIYSLENPGIKDASKRLGAAIRRKVSAKKA